MVRSLVTETEGYSLAELMVVLVILGILALIAIPQFMGVMNKAHAIEAKQQLKQVLTLENAYRYEYNTFTTDLKAIGFEQAKMSTEGGTANYQIRVEKADANDFLAVAQAVVDFDNDGTLNVWEVQKDGVLRERTPD